MTSNSPICFPLTTHFCNITHLVDVLFASPHKFSFLHTHLNNRITTKYKKNRENFGWGNRWHHHSHHQEGSCSCQQNRAVPTSTQPPLQQASGQPVLQNRRAPMLLEQQAPTPLHHPIRREASPSGTLCGLPVRWVGPLIFSYSQHSSSGLTGCFIPQCLKIGESLCFLRLSSLFFFFSLFD